MKVACIFSIALMMSAFLSGCLDQESRKAPAEYSPVYTGMNDLVNSSNVFSFDMYRHLLSK